MDTNIVIPAITGLGGLIIGTFTPFVKWYIEKKKLRYNNRKELISKSRQYIASTKEFSNQDFCNSVLYASLRPYLSEKTVKELEIQTNKIDIIVGSNRYGIVSDILDDLHRIEKKWDLL